LHFPGAPVEPDWTKALGVFATENPAVFGTVLLIIAIAEGESVGHSGDNFRGKSTKKVPGDLNFDYLGIKKKVSAEKFARYQEVEIKVRQRIMFTWGRRRNACTGCACLENGCMESFMVAYYHIHIPQFLVCLLLYFSVIPFFILQNGRAAMIAMASLFAWKSIPGSVPIMDILAP
jgi:hypothetical protein